jgi:hypothetical protein
MAKGEDRRGIPAIGNVGKSREVATRGLLDIRVATEHFQTTTFYVAPEDLAKLWTYFA